MIEYVDLLPIVISMGPSIGIAVTFLGLTLFVSFFFDWNQAEGLERLIVIIMMTIIIFGISLSIGNVISYEFVETVDESSDESIVLVDEEITVHEEFLIALVVEMIGAIIFVPPIYGSEKPQHIYRSMTISILFILIFFLPVGFISRVIFTTDPEIINNYVTNLRVELLSIIILFFAITSFRIATLKKRHKQAELLQQMLVMLIAIVAVLAVFNSLILEPQYENIWLALGAAGATILIVAIAKIHRGMLMIVMFVSLFLSVLFLIGTQIPDFPFAAPTSINFAAELIGAITVALILDTDMDV